MKKILFILVILFGLSKLVKLFTTEWYPMRHLAYLKYVVRHKWFVFEECLKLGLPLHVAILHDWDKFLPDEWNPYAEAFYGVDGKNQYLPEVDFTYAWNDHQKRNKHHWQYWMITWDKGNTEYLQIPIRYAKEMLADWRGAGRAITGEDNTIGWYTQNRDNIKLHPRTRLWIEEQLGYQADE